MIEFCLPTQVWEDIWIIFKCFYLPFFLTIAGSIKYVKKSNILFAVNTFPSLFYKSAATGKTGSAAMYLGRSHLVVSEQIAIFLSPIKYNHGILFWDIYNLYKKMIQQSNYLHFKDCIKSLISVVWCVLKSSWSVFSTLPAKQLCSNKTDQCFLTLSFLKPTLAVSWLFWTVFSTQWI